MPLNHENEWCSSVPVHSRLERWLLSRWCCGHQKFLRSFPTYSTFDAHGSRCWSTAFQSRITREHTSSVALRGHELISLSPHVHDVYPRQSDCEIDQKRTDCRTAHDTTTTLSISILDDENEQNRTDYDWDEGQGRTQCANHRCWTTRSTWTESICTLYSQ